MSEVRKWMLRAALCAMLGFMLALSGCATPPTSCTRCTLGYGDYSWLCSCCGERCDCGKDPCVITDGG